MTTKPLRLLIAGGGTGGHLYPGLAIAHEFLRQAPGSRVEFAGSAYGLEKRVVPQQGFKLHLLPVRGLYGVSWLKRLRVGLLLPLAFLKALWVLATLRPHAVVGVGGYASGPMLATAVLTGRATFIQEQNAYPGMTNRLLGRWVRLAFVPVAGLEGYFPRHRVVGNPVRAEIMALRQPPAAPRAKTQLLVLGGSQGARRVNQAMVEALPLLAPLADRLSIVHQTGQADLDWVSQAYAQWPIPHQVTPFLEDMAGALSQSSLVVSRAGASAVAELICARRASVLIPIPGASGDHQRKNALRLQQEGASRMLEQKDLSGQSLAQTLLALLEAPAELERMEAACDPLYGGDAAQKMVRLLLQSIGRG